MKSLFEPLLHANAKAFAILFAGVFIGMLGWGGYTEYAARQADARAQEEASRRSEAPLPTFAEPAPIGLLAYVDSQTATGTEDAHLPIDLFRCPLDEHGNVVRPGAQPTPQDTATEPAPETPISHDVEALMDDAENQQLISWSGGTHSPSSPNAWSSQPPPTPRNHELVYQGVFQKTDGSLAAFVSDKGTGEGRFISPGDSFAGATIVSGDTQKLRLRLADGSEHDLLRGGEPVITGQIPPPPGAQRPRQRQRRLPTESEIKEIEKRNPDLARRLREAIRRQNEQQQQQQSSQQQPSQKGGN